MTKRGSFNGFMAGRFEPRDSLDDFPTPPWATRALTRWLGITRGAGLSVREPAANRGHMVRPLAEVFDHVEASDVHDYGAGFPVADYLCGPEAGLGRTDWTITNPPFRLAEAFIDRALALSDVGVAMLLRTSFVEGIGRHQRLFGPKAPTDVLQFAERVVMHKGRLAPLGSTATAYAWFVWLRPPHPTRLHWIPPCRAGLERPEDYTSQNEAA